MHRDWQDKNTDAEARHRAAEETKMRIWQEKNAAALEEHNARQRERQGVYDHAMKQVHQPRLTPTEVERLTGKPDGAQVASSMIVFAKAGDILNLQLAPYFRLAPAPSGRGQDEAPLGDPQWSVGRPLDWINPDTGTRWYTVPEQPRDVPDGLPPIVQDLAATASFWSVQVIRGTNWLYVPKTPVCYVLMDGSAGPRMEWADADQLKEPRFNIWLRTDIEQHLAGLAKLMQQCSATISRQRWLLIFGNGELIRDMQRHRAIYADDLNYFAEVLRQMGEKHFLIQKSYFRLSRRLTDEEVTPDFVVQFAQQKSKETA